MIARTLIAHSLLVVALVACGGDETGGTTTTTGGTDATSGFDTTLSNDLGTTAPTTDTSATSESDTAIVPGGFGAACQGNIDCDSNLCVEGPTGFICTRTCLDTCPEDYDCRAVQGPVDVILMCMPRVRKLCAPCLEDFQCNGGACLTIDGEKQCATACETAEDCPGGYGCAPDATAARSGSFCQPLSGSCACSPLYEGVARACTRASELGTCIGAETCDPQVGWTGCSAREPSTEACNYVDDDCDNAIDEDFQIDGVYASDDACGSCTTDCGEVLPNTLSTRCAVSGGLARCEVVECAPGFTLLNPFVCAPDSGSQCQPCVSAAECLGVGAGCTELDDGTFCTTGCDEPSDCDTGFVCQAIDGIPTMQCVPESGSCTCDGTNTDLARACDVTYTPPDPDEPSVVCRGFEQCTASGWGGCVLPEEACDGRDNDCDGVVDQPFKTGDKYTTVQHCGACDINCGALSGPNAAPSCDASGAVPVCGFTCVGDARDVNGIADDGCECIPIAGPDLAGDSLDSDCDGIDGEIGNGIFVSKSGDDANPGTRELPVLKVQTAIARAAAQTKRDVYVATGVYSENIVLANGVGVFGGYAPFFDEHDVVLFETALVGQAPDATRIGTVTAIGLGTTPGAAESVLDGFTVFGINAANLSAQNSYAIYVRDSGAGLRIAHNRVLAGPGGNGTNGNNGSNGATGVGGAGGAGAKDTGNNGCAVIEETVGGGGGAQTCGGTNVGGGAGGRGECPVYDQEPTNTNRGASGAGPAGGSGGFAGWDSAWFDSTGFGDCSCGIPPDNNPYTAGPGAPGTSGASGAFGQGCTQGSGSVSGGFWNGAAGTAGGAGGHGSGGGGGGAGGGVIIFDNICNPGGPDVGGSGGGGGSGGCAAQGGTGGASGGGSFGVFVVGSASNVPTLSANVVQGGRGGAGGNGGPGGAGGVGGRGGIGGVSGDTYSGMQYDQTWCASGGGTGGNGGDGGHGGGGGGGCGGASYGIYASGAAPAAWKTNNTFISGATGGAAGKGGASIDQTKAGRDGQAGAAANTNF